MRRSDLSELKISLIGAGSLTFTPSLIKALASSGLSDDHQLTIALMDINPHILDVMYKVALEIVKTVRGENIKNIRVEKHAERKQALEGADFIIITIGIGGVKATHFDVEIPRHYGIEQIIGDTVGPGGVMRAIRHIPTMVEIATDIKENASKAYVFNYSNPLTALTRAMKREAGINVYGLCTGISGVQHELARFFQVKPDDVKLYIGGINHFYWILNFNIGRKPGYEALEVMLKEKSVLVERWHRINLDLYRIYGLLPEPGIHVAEFLPNLFLTPEAIRKYNIRLFPKGTIYDYEARKPYEELLKAIASGVKPVSELLKIKGMEEEGIGVVQIIESLTLDKPMFSPGINMINNGCVGGLPSWTIVEVPAYIDSAGIHPIHVGNLPKSIVGLTTPRVIQYEVTIDAALTGDKDLAVQALLLDGYVRNLKEAEEMLNDLIRAEAEWLPDYWKA